MYSTADALCPIDGSQMLAARIGATDLTAKPHEGLYHEILNEPEQDRVLDENVRVIGIARGGGGVTMTGW